jgi:amidase
MRTVTFEESGAFIERFSLPATGDGPLGGLRFAVKDLIDVAGYRTGCGNPTWRETHPPAVLSAVCVDQLLAAGARCEGKTVTDELAFSLLGENHHYGTPLNPAAPERVPGGSSSGSASSVACGLVDFALGTDTGGSVRVPASNCGIWGWRPTHGVISVAGVVPLAPTLDTVGVLADRADVLRRVGGILLASSTTTSAKPGRFHVIAEALEMADAAVRGAFRAEMDRLGDRLGGRIGTVSLGEICRDVGASDLSTWLETYRVLMATEVQSIHSTWIASAQPALGPATLAGFEYVRSIDRSRLTEAIGRREQYCKALRHGLAHETVLCMPTAPTIAPPKGTTHYNRSGDYYRRTLSLTAIAGVGRLPQVSMPLAMVDGAPLGISLLGTFGEDLFLLDTARQIGELWQHKEG